MLEAGAVHHGGLLGRLLEPQGVPDGVPPPSGEEVEVNPAQAAGVHLAVQLLDEAEGPLEIPVRPPPLQEDPLPQKLHLGRGVPAAAAQGDGNHALGHGGLFYTPKEPEEKEEEGEEEEKPGAPGAEKPGENPEDQGAEGQGEEEGGKVLQKRPHGPSL